VAAPRAQEIVFTLYGDYLLDRGRAVRVGSLIELLGQLGVAAPAARTALSRMTAKGWLTVTRGEGRSLYDLSARGRRLLEEGRERIYHPPRRASWDGRWYLVAYSIPESRRGLRDRLRTQLAWLGCGALTNGLWIAAHDPSAEVRESARRLRIERHVEVFRAEHLGFSDAAKLVERSWDLASVNRRYRAFLERWRPELDHCATCRRASEGATAGRPLAPCTSPADCFRRRFELVHQYRVFPSIDPFLPAPLLPPDWLGEEAARLFETYRAVLAEPAERYVAEVCAAGERDAPPSGASPPPSRRRISSISRPR
jgi:phenylacetic acid degradation operon negative regulatory protein